MLAACGRRSTARHWTRAGGPWSPSSALVRAVIARPMTRAHCWHRSPRAVPARRREQLDDRDAIERAGVGPPQPAALPRHGGQRWAGRRHAAAVWRPVGHRLREGRGLEGPHQGAARREEGTARLLLRHRIQCLEHGRVRATTRRRLRHHRGPPRARHSSRMRACPPSQSYCAARPCASIYFAARRARSTLGCAVPSSASSGRTRRASWRSFGTSRARRTTRLRRSRWPRFAALPPLPESAACSIFSGGVGLLRP